MVQKTGRDAGYGRRMEEILAMLPLDEYEGCYLTTSDAFHCKPLSNEPLPEADILNLFLRSAETSAKALWHRAC